MTSHASEVLLGYSVPTGTPVTVPIRHLAVTGQTQESGKTTTLEALVARSGLRAIAFVTKRAEGSFHDGRRIKPYFRHRGDWQFVASILEATMRQKLKFERAWIVRASKGAATLSDVQRNVQHLQAAAKRSMDADQYLLLNEYLEIVIPQIERLPFTETLELEPGLNVMDLGDYTAELQALVIRSVLEWVYEREHDVITIIPEAWEFLPQSRSSPVLLAAEQLIRKGAASRNYLWIDSQDLAAVHKAILRSVSVWVLGVQREANEVKRVLANIPKGAGQPKAAEIMQLERGQFYACCGGRTIKTYVQPAWLDGESARRVAIGDARPPAPPQRKEKTVTPAEASTLREENQQLRQQVRDLSARLAALEGKDQPRERAATAPPPAAPRPEAPPQPRADAPASSDNGRRPYSTDETFVNEDVYQAFKARLIEELPSDARVLRIVTQRPELRVEVERQILTVDGLSLRGRVGRLIAEEFFSNARTSSDIQSELGKRGKSPSNIELGNELKALVEFGFFTRDNKWFRLVESMRVNVVEA